MPPLGHIRVSFLSDCTSLPLCFYTPDPPSSPKRGPRDLNPARFVQVSLEFINRYFYYNIQPLTSEIMGASSKVSRSLWLMDHTSKIRNVAAQV